jgi:hypothetical protein
MTKFTASGTATIPPTGSFTLLHSLAFPGQQILFTPAFPIVSSLYGYSGTPIYNNTSQPIPITWYIACGPNSTYCEGSGASQAGAEWQLKGIVDGPTTSATTLATTICQ